VTLYLFIYTAQLFESVFLWAYNPGRHADRPPSHSAHLATSAKAELSGACGHGL